MSFSLVFKLDHHFDFHWSTSGQRRDSYGSSRVTSGITEDFDQQIRGAVDDFGLRGVIVWTVYESTHPDDKQLVYTPVFHHTGNR